MTDTEMPNKEAGSSMNNVLYLGLYLILLAFFILLIGISKFEEKRTQAVVGSITNTFQASMTEGSGIDVERLPAALADFLSAQAFQRNVEDLFRSLLPHSEVQVSRPGELMHVVLPVDVLFAPGSDVLRYERLPLLRRIASVLEDHPPNQRFDIEFVVGGALPRSGDESDPLPLAISWAAELARSLKDHGAPGGSLAAGVKNGGAGRVFITFVTRDPAVDQASFGGGGGG